MKQFKMLCYLLKKVPSHERERMIYLFLIDPAGLSNRYDKEQTFQEKLKNSWLNTN